MGEKIKAEVLVVGKEEIFVSTGTASDGIVTRRDLASAEGALDLKVGDVLDLYVTQVRGTQVYLSPKPTSKNLADDLEDAYKMRLPVEGRVAEVVKGGFRVSVHGKLAFCPISQMDVKRIETPEEYIGQRFEFRITQINEDGRNVIVSRRKHLDEQRGASQGTFLEEHPEGSIVNARITRIEKFGAFAEVAPGVEGLIHISELSWSRVENPHDVLQMGQDVHVKVLKTETVEGRLKISLSMKQSQAEPWEHMPSSLKEGQIVEGKVTRCMKFGAFVELSPGIEGLIPLSEMSYTKRVMRSDELVKEGDRIAVKINEINAGAKRISLSLKDAGSDPWALALQKYPVGAIVTGRVERREPYGIFVQLEEGMTALLPKSKASENSEFPYEKLKPGETVTVQIGEVRREERRISLTVPQDPNRDDWKSFVSPASTSLGSFGGALGDQLKKALEKKSENKPEKKR